MSSISEITEEILGGQGMPSFLTLMSPVEANEVRSFAITQASWPARQTTRHGNQKIKHGNARGLLHQASFPASLESKAFPEKVRLSRTAESHV